MITSANIPIKVTTSCYEVIASGVVHLTEPEVKFELANLKIKYVFKTDEEGKGRFKGEVVDGGLVMNLFNFSNSLGEGVIQPIEIGTLNERRLFSTCFVHTTTKNIRQFNYTFMLMEA